MTTPFNPIDPDILLNILKDKPLTGLKTEWSRANKLRAKGGNILGGSYHSDEAYLVGLKRLIEARMAEESAQFRVESSISQLASQASQLAREHHVSEKVARSFLERAMRKDIKPAPDPEPAPKELTKREQWEEKWGKR